MDPISFAALLASLKALIATIKKVVALCTDSKEAWAQIKKLFSSTPASKAKHPTLTPEQAEFKRVAEKEIRRKNAETRIANAKIDMDERYGLGTAHAVEVAQALEKEKQSRENEKRHKRKRDKDRASKEFFDKVFRFLVGLGQLLLIAGAASLVAYLVWINRCVEGQC
tara:strand:+ start:199 stop:702 length:504 start_codon:yes stop_codon:yes gene_type:complete